MTSTSPSGAGAPIRVRLIQPHTHAGRARQPGDEINVVPLVADWLRTHAIGHAVSVSAATLVPSTAAAPAPTSATTPGRHSQDLLTDR